MTPNEMHLASYRRHLRARNRAQNTINGYEMVLTRLADHYQGTDLAELSRAQIDDYLGVLLGHLAATTVGIHFRSLRAFYSWAAAEDLVERSPMARMKPPTVTDKPPPVVGDEDIRALLKACAGSDFEARRDTALIRLWCEPGSPRVSEMAGLMLGDLDLKHDRVTVHGKGNKIRTIPFGAKTGQAIDRYLRVRARHTAAHLDALWLGGRGMGITSSGLEQMLKRRCRQAGIERVRPHQLRHTAAHQWFDHGGSDQDSMELFGWSSPEMPRVYGRSAKTERAHRAARRASIADRL